MAQNPKVALFPAHESIAPQISPLNRKAQELSIRQVSSVSQLLKLIEEDEETFDVIIVPSLLADRTSAVTMCIQIKSQESLAAIPILVISALKDVPAISAFYGSGADTVIVTPFDAEIVYLQIIALGRLTRSLMEETEANQRDRGLRQAIITALHFIDEALVICDTSLKVIFANRAARELLNLYDQYDEESERRVFSIIENSAAMHLKPFLAEDSSSISTTITLPVVELERVNRSRFQSEMRSTTLISSNGDIHAYCLTINDISAPKELSNSILQTERMQSLSLMLATSCMSLMRSSSLGDPGSPLARIEALLDHDPPSCSLTDVITTAVEIIDLIVSTNSSIKVNISGDYSVGMKRSDLFQLVGHLILYTTRIAPGRSETVIRIPALKNEKFLVLSIMVRTELITLKDMTSNRRSLKAEIAQMNQIQSIKEDDKLQLGFFSAQKIAQKYGLTIYQNELNETEYELVVDIPLN